jgi:ATP-dependent Clp protease ATP-binding subunit ClpA
MLVTLPIYVEVRRESGQQIHRCRPLFFRGSAAEDQHLSLALGKLQRRLKQQLDLLGSESRHDDFAAHCFLPDLDTHVLKLTLDLRDRLARCKLLFVTFESLGRRIAFSPALPDLWFEISPTSNLEQRATEVLANHFRRLKRREHSGGEGTPESVSLEGQAWVTTIELDVKTRQASKSAIARKLAALFDDTKPSGGFELQRAGRCLDWLYPEDLSRAAGREREVDQLFRLLAGEDIRPVVVVGPRLSGKTTVIHECVRRRVSRRRKRRAARHNTWLLSPQRLISGMMYVGQWEGRVQAILREARRRKHILYFDDFLGLYHAGISRDASLSVADMLKSFILRREVRILAEMTPEAWHALQELDRGLADQFHVLRIAATGEEETRRIMLDLHRRLEAQHRVQFAIDALPAILQLQQSYIRDAAFPGKAAAFSQQLAKRYAKRPVARTEVYQEFQLKTGLALELVDDRLRLDRDNVVARLRTKLVGQDAAVQAAADVMTIAKARLADPARPLGTFLFLGPTGVGKTQCAKALAEVMFNGSGRLLRFDMNEFVSPFAAAQLTGTFDEPDGLLTSAVRRQPFSVVLLDEIEKAHPDVFDLLLQVTGEGRLTDALGRTADFSNTVVIMTSNLGTTTGQVRIGLDQSDATHQNAYVKAAEAFFRPEFVNRIDRIIPFESLSRNQMRRIADLLLSDVFQRDGLVRRRCALSVEPSAMERIVDAGYHPQFGARALKRVIERQLLQPVAAKLAGVRPELPAVISVSPRPGGVTAIVQPLESVGPRESSGFDDLEPAEQLARVGRYVERVESEIATARPEESDTGRGLSVAQLHYYSVKEQLFRIRANAARLEEQLDLLDRGARGPAHSFKPPAEKQPVRRRHWEGQIARHLREIQAAQDLHDYLRETAAGAPRLDDLQVEFAALRQEVALLNAVASSPKPERVIMIVRALVHDLQSCEKRLADALAGLAEELGFACDRDDGQSRSSPPALVLAGPGIWPLATAESGVHIFCSRHENLLPVQVSIFRADEENASQQVAKLRSVREAWLQGVAAGSAAVDADPWPLGPIVRFYDDAGPTLDLRTGRSLPGFPTGAEHKILILSGLPLPEELNVA